MNLIQLLVGSQSLGKVYIYCYGRLARHQLLEMCSNKNEDSQSESHIILQGNRTTDSEC